MIGLRVLPRAGLKMFRTASKVMCFLAGLLAGMNSLVAQATDPHTIYEDKCARCHEDHGGDFVHKNLKIEDGRVVGKTSGKAIGAFLERGHGNLGQPELTLLIDHLNSIALTGQIYQTKCLICHDRAVELARARLVLKDGALIGRYSGRVIGDFLVSHGRLDDEERATIRMMLERQLTDGNR
jgi:hypothetical protein